MEKTGPDSIRTERLRLRLWRDDDLAAFREMNSDPRVMEFFPSVLSSAQSDEFAARIRQHFATHGFGLWAVEVLGGAPFIGYVGLCVPRFESFFTPCVEIGWRLSAEHWGRGYATEAAKACLEFGFNDVGNEEIVSMTTVENRASRRVMEKIGMVRDPMEDFDHPLVPVGSPLRPHVLYRLGRGDFERQKDV